MGLLIFDLARLAVGYGGCLLADDPAWQHRWLDVAQGGAEDAVRDVLRLIRERNAA